MVNSKELADPGRPFRIEIIGRFIGKDHHGIQKQRPGHCHPALLSDAQLVRKIASGDFSGPGPSTTGFRLRFEASFASQAPAPGHCQARRESQSVVDFEKQNRKNGCVIVTWHRQRAGDLLPLEQHFTAQWLEQQTEQRQQGRLTASRRARNRQRFSRSILSDTSLKTSRYHISWKYRQLPAASISPRL